MPLLEILKYPDPKLRVKAQPIVQIDNKIHALANEMYETMYSVKGVGLAATQVGVHQRLFVMDVSEARDERYCIINPEILSCDGLQFETEGCLSVGDAFDRVTRAATIRFRGLDLKGNIVEMDAAGLMAACVQHEIDHLNGVLFIDHLSRLKQERLRKKTKKLQHRAFTEPK